MKRLLQGNTAIVEGALKAGCDFYAGYPITPSSEIMHEMASRLPALGGTFIQTEDEIAAINTIIGASLAGARPMTATSGPGFSLMQEAIGLAVAYETPLVIIDVMRGGPSTGMPTRPHQGDILQAIHGSHGVYKLIVLAAYSVKSAYEVTIRSFELAEKYATPVVMLADETISHMFEVIDFEEREPKIESHRKPKLGEGVFYTGLVHGEDGLPTVDPQEAERYYKRLLKKIEEASKDFLYETLFIDDADIVIVSYGSASRSAERAVKILREEGIKAALLRLITLSPIDGKKISSLLEDRKAFSVEMNEGQLAYLLGSYSIEPIPFLKPEIPDPREIVSEVKKRLRVFILSRT